MKKRSIVLLLLVLISVITFLDRINITMASGDIMAELGLTESQWGWVLSVFTISYGLMQAVLGWFFANVWAPPVSQDLLNTLTGIAANCLYIVLNYIGQKFFVFREKKAD